MRLFTKLRAEEIKLIEYPVQPEVQPETVKPVTDESDHADDISPEVIEAKEEMVVITTLHGDSHEMPKADLLLAPAIAERKDPAGELTGPQVGDWLVQDYDIQTDKRITKVYDTATFQRYFKASIGG